MSNVLRGHRGDRGMVKMPGKRIQVFDLLKLWAIFLVLWGHALQHLQSVEPSQDALYRIIYSFHMPLFMMLSGYFAPTSLSLRPCDFFLKKGRALLLPAFVWTTLIWLTLNAHDTLNGHSSFAWPDLSEYACNMVTDFWFLKSCFICHALCFWGSRCFPKAYGHVFLLVLCQLKNVYFISVMFPAFMVGYLLGCNPRFLLLVQRYGHVLGGVFLVMLCFWDGSMWQRPPAVYVRVYSVMIGIVGSLAIVALALRLYPMEKESRNPLWLHFASWGRFTLGIYILQVLLMEHLVPHLFHFERTDGLMFRFVYTPLLALGVLGVCVCLVRLIRWNRYVSFLLLGTRL